MGMVSLGNTGLKVSRLGMGPIPNAPEDPILLALGFVLAHDEVDTAIVGTRNPKHMQTNIDWIETVLSIAVEAIEELHHRFDEVGQQWRQQS